MQVNNHSNASYGYGMQVESSKPLPERTQSNERDTYGSALLERFDDKAYQAFLNSTAEFSQADKALAANTLDKTAALSAANQYATTHEVTVTQDLAVVYNFFTNYQDVVSSEQIKHLLNSRLQNSQSVEGKQFESEQFFKDFTAQLGGQRSLDLLV